MTRTSRSIGRDDRRDDRRGDRLHATDINSGGRALTAVVRPYPRATAGEPLRLRFDPWRHVFEFAFRHDPQLTAPTELFIPNLHYPRGYRVAVSDGRYEANREQQTLVYHHSAERAEHTLRIWPA